MAKKKVPKTAAGRPSRKGVLKAKTITKEIAQSYLKDTNSVDLNTFMELDDKAAEVLSKSDGWLELSGLTHLSDAAAKGLAKFKGISLELNGLTEVLDSVAQSLARVDSCLELNGLTFLTDGLARMLASHSRQLELNGVASLSDEAARHLSRRKKGRLELRGLKSASDTVAKSLASCKDDLELGVVALSDASAAAFASFAHILELPNLTALSGAAAKSFETLDCEGRLILSEHFCKTRARLKELCPEWKGLLRYDGWTFREKSLRWKDVPENVSHMLLRVLNQGIDASEVKVTRITLLPKGDAAKEQFFVAEFRDESADFAASYVANASGIVAEFEN